LTGLVGPGDAGAPLSKPSWLAVFAVTVTVAGAAVGAAPRVPAAPAPVPVLGPTLFAGWQTANVSDPVVVRDPSAGGFRMYYSGSATEQVSDAAWDLWATGLVTSRDGRHWAYPDDYEPVLPAARFLEGEVVDPARRSAVFDSMEARVGSVVRAGARSWMYYTGWNGDDRPAGRGRAEKVHFRIGAAVSADGRRWSKRAGGAEAGAVLGLGASGAPDALSIGSPTVVRERLRFRMWYETGDGSTWRVAHATSPDGLAWTATGVVLEPGAGGSLDELGARHPVVLAVTSGYELWYQGRSRSSPAFHVLRARSVDGRVWRKVAGEVALRAGAALEGDEEIRVGSVLARPDGGREVFFAKETTSTRAAAFGTVSRRTTAIYAEMVAAAE
jgi:hypothetical protein